LIKTNFTEEETKISSRGNVGARDDADEFGRLRISSFFILETHQEEFCKPERK
jgi:hypothetical protein